MIRKTWKTIAVLATLGLAGACSGESAANGAAGAGASEALLYELDPEIAADIGGVVGPSLHVGRRTVNFGTIWQGAVREVVFPLVSSGTEPLHIKRVNASCGCTVVEARVLEASGAFRPLVYDEDLAPGTRVEIVARFDSRGRHGYEKKTVEVYSDDVQGGHSLEIGVETEPWLVSDVEGIDFSRVFPGQPVTRVAHITSSTNEPFALVASASRPLPDGMTFELSADVPVPGETPIKALHWTLAVTLGPGAPSGVLMAPFLLETDKPFEDQGPVGEAKPVEHSEPESPDSPHIHDAVADSPHIHDAVTEGLVRPTNHFLDVWTRATVLAPIAPDTPYLSFGFLQKNAVTSASVRIECFDGDLAEAFLGHEPKVTMTDPVGGELAQASAFTPTLRKVEPGSSGGNRPLTAGSFGAWDLEVAAVGFSGEGQNRVQGRIEIAPGGPDSGIDPIIVTFQVIVQP